MTMLILGLIVFFATHLIPAMPAIKQGLISRLGDKIYQGLFALASLAGFVLIVLGMVRAPEIEVWQPPAWGRTAAPLLMLLALYSLAAKDMPSNLKRLTRHPMLWGVALWATSHLLNNGDQASILLFGGFLLYALFDMWPANRRGAVKSTVHYPLTQELKTVVTGIVVYAVLLFLHPYLFGVAVI